MKLRIAIDIKNPVLQLALYAAERQHYFQSRGLAVTLVEFPDGRSTADALVQRAVDAASSGFDRVLRGNEDNAALKAFGVLSRSPLLVLITNHRAKEAPQSVTDLSDKRLAIDTAGSEADLFACFVLHEAGIDPASIRTIPEESFAGAANALQAFDADAAVLDSAGVRRFQTQAGDAGVLADTRTVAGLLSVYGASSYPGSCLFAKSDWLAAHPDEAQRLMRAVADGVRWCQQHAPAEVSRVFPDPIRNSLDPVALAAVVGEAVPLLSRSGSFSADGVEAVRRVLAVSLTSFRKSGTASGAYTNDFVSR